LARFLIFAALAVFLAGSVAWQSPWLKPAFWFALVSPGRLSAAHAHLAADCFACHTPARGPEAERCIACHAAETALLARQPTAFHADIGACAQCHFEHFPSHPAKTDMTHAVLARRGLVMLQEDASRNSERAWLRLGLGSTSASERNLDCAACHRIQDKHAGYFGRECAACHETSRWTIADFRHPAPDSVHCVQCHAAPPSHYMEHFSMVSQSIAHSPATVEQCYSCHQTTVWNDIRGVGYYDHH